MKMEFQDLAMEQQYLVAMEVQQIRLKIYIIQQ